MEGDNAATKAQDLSDLELAILLSLISLQHAIIQANADVLEDLEAELKLASQRTFGLSAISVQCTADMALDDFTQSVLVDGLPLEHSLVYSSKDDSRIPNVIVMRDLHLTSRTIQMQAMELLKSRRIFTHTAVHPAPKQFLVIIISAVGSQSPVNHLRDYVYLSHTHDTDDGFPNIEDAPSDQQSTTKPLLTSSNIEALSKTIDNVVVAVDVMRYIHDIAVFLRMHRAVAAGMTPLATQHFLFMCRSLACLHGLRYVTPSLVALAARKVFRHRLVFVTPSTERSMQYGSDVSSVASLLRHLSPEAVIEEVLASVDCPL